MNLWKAREHGGFLRASHIIIQHMAIDIRVCTVGIQHVLTEERVLRADTWTLYVFWKIDSIIVLDLSLYFTSKVGSAGCNVLAVGVNVKENSYVHEKITRMNFLTLFYQ